MGFGEAETTIVLRSIAELSKNVLGHSARGTVDIRATSKGSKKRLMFTFFNYCLRREDVQQRLCDNVSENRQARIWLSEKGGMTGEIEIESDFEGGSMIQIRIKTAMI